MFAIVETGGKQYRVAEGDTVDVEKLDLEVDAKVELDRVTLLQADDTVRIGTPYVEGAKVVGRVVKQGKGPKIRGFVYKPKKNYRRRFGHRQPFTRIQIEKIEG